jgi:hypothetical protein
MSKQKFVTAFANLLTANQGNTEEITRFGTQIAEALQDYDFTPDDALAAAETFANAFGIEDEEDATPSPAIADASDEALVVFCVPSYVQNPAPPTIIKESPLMKLIEQSDLFL